MSIDEAVHGFSEGFSSKARSKLTFVVAMYALLGIGSCIFRQDAYSFKGVVQEKYSTAFPEGYVLVAKGVSEQQPDSALKTFKLTSADSSAYAALDEGDTLSLRLYRWQNPVKDEFVIGGNQILRQ